MKPKYILIRRLANLLSIKSVVTVIMTVVLAVMLLGNYQPPQELLTLYCTSYGAVLTYYFTRKDKDDENGE